MDELVRGFAEGQLSRRVFIRRLVAAGVALSGAIAYADLLQAHPAGALAPASQVDVADYAFAPVKHVLGTPGEYVSWVWDPSASGHTISDASDSRFFDSSPDVWYMDDDGTKHWTSVDQFGHEFWAAGTFPYRCKYKDKYHDGHPMEGKIRVPVVLGATSGRVGKTFEVTWSAGDPLSRPGFSYDVQLRKPGRGWKDWVVDSQSPAATYTAKTAGKHQFRARLRRLSSGTSGWSPAATFRAH